MSTSKKPSKPSTEKGAKDHPHYCSMIPIPARTFDSEVSPNRERMILMSNKKWVNGTKLKYYFFNGPTDGSPSSWKGTTAQKNTVKQAFKVWKDIGIGLEFEETTNRNEAQVRIGFKRGDGAWSYVGRDIIDIASSPNERTMNFDWDISNDLDTALHEIGHTLGAPHEHQNPNAGIVWDEEAVYDALAAPPNGWDRETTYYNIIRKLPANEVEGSTHDPNSIMHYPFEAGLILSPAAYRNGINPPGGLSNKDIEYMKKFYPALKPADILELKVAESKPFNVKAGEQLNFSFKPTSSRRYTIETFGRMDTVMVLYEKSGSQDIYLAGDDDSGTGLNSKIQLRLIAGREYIIRVRLYYAEITGAGSLMVY